MIFKKEKAREQVSSLACRQTSSPSNNLSDVASGLLPFYALCILVIEHALNAV